MSITENRISRRWNLIPILVKMICMLFTLLTCITRINDNMHHCLDVIFGCIVGIVSALTIYKIENELDRYAITSVETNENNWNVFLCLYICKLYYIYWINIVSVMKLSFYSVIKSFLGFNFGNLDFILMLVKGRRGAWGVPIFILFLGVTKCFLDLDMLPLISLM